MRPVPNLILSLLLLALCGLCAWQWNRESRLRSLAAAQHDEITAITTERDELQSRVKAADAEVLRITASLAEQRASSVSKETHAEILQANMTLRDAANKQGTMITEQNELLAKQNTAMQQANESIKKLSTARDDLAKRLNEVTALYNKLAKPPKQ